MDIFSFVEAYELANGRGSRFTRVAFFAVLRACLPEIDGLHLHRVGLH